jgi:hypothetical protein
VELKTRMTRFTALLAENLWDQLNEVVETGKKRSKFGLKSLGRELKSLAEEWKHVTWIMSVSEAETDPQGHLFLELSLFWLV